MELPADFEQGQTNKSPEFLEKFPLGKVPTFETPSGFKLAESSAIAAYIAASGPKHGQLLGETLETRALNSQWILFNELHVEISLFALAAWRMNIEEYDAKKEEKAAKELKRWLDYYEKHLGDRKWFVNADNEGPSLADLTIGGSLFMLYFAYVDADMRKEFPKLLEFFENIKSIPVLTKLYTGPMVEKRQAPPN